MDEERENYPDSDESPKRDHLKQIYTDYKLTAEVKD